MWMEDQLTAGGDTVGMSHTGASEEAESETGTNHSYTPTLLLPCGRGLLLFRYVGHWLSNKKFPVEIYFFYLAIMFLFYFKSSYLVQVTAKEKAQNQK